MTEKQLLHRDDGAVVTNTLPRFNPGEALGENSQSTRWCKTSVSRGYANIVGKAFGGNQSGVIVSGHRYARQRLRWIHGRSIP